MFYGQPRVNGILAVTRSIGDRILKEHVSLTLLVKPNINNDNITGYGTARYNRGEVDTTGRVHHYGL